MKRSLVLVYLVSLLPFAPLATFAIEAGESGSSAGASENLKCMSIEDAKKAKLSVKQRTAVYRACLEEFKKKVAKMKQGASEGPAVVRDIGNKQLDYMMEILQEMLANVAADGEIGRGLTQTWREIQDLQQSADMFDPKARQKRLQTLEKLKGQYEEQKKRTLGLHNQLSGLLKTIVETKPLLAWDLRAKNAKEALEYLDAAINHAEGLVHSFEETLTEASPTEHRGGN